MYYNWLFQMVAILIASLSLFVLLYALYNVYLHPLRRYPGPWLWKAFRIPYVVALHRGVLHRHIEDLHHRYGPIVRIAPNELSFTDPRAWTDIYGNRQGHLPFERNQTTFRKTGPVEALSIMSYNEAAHSRFRKVFVHSFSEQSLREQAPIIEEYVEAWIQKLKAFAKAGNVVDLTQWFDFLTFDISGDFSFGESFDCIKNGEAHPWVAITRDFGKGLALISTINMYPPMHKVLKYALPRKMMERQVTHRKISAEKARKRLASDSERPGFITSAKKVSDRKGTITPIEWDLNMTILIFVSSETTSSALTGIIRMLLQHPEALRKLEEEIRTSFHHASEITIGSTGNLQYLDAVIQEGIRLCPPTAIGIQRVVPKGGDSVCGQMLPEGTWVAVHPFPTYRSLSNFGSPDSFKPERFIRQCKADNMAAFQPFGTGRHSCIGMKLAYAEMRLTLTRLLFTFNISLADPNDQWDWASQKLFLTWEKAPLQVKLQSVSP